ncbi:EI24 domain-containing protein [Candidatus Poribacteria bacterium]|nr:EI24 domain-containing protein [Candidatus Poribacteria bacterium]
MAPFQGIAALARRPRCLALCLAPWALNLFLIFPLFVWLTLQLVYEPAAEFMRDRDWSMLVSAPLEILLLSSVFAIGIIGFIAMALVTGAPFHDKVGELLEREFLAGRPDLLPQPVPFARGAALATVGAVKRVLLVLPPFLLILALGVIPFLGAVLVLFLEAVLGSAFLTLDAFSMPLDRRQGRLRMKLRWIRSHWRFVLGFGLPFVLLPCAFAFAPPVSAAAATVVFCRVLQRHHSPPAGSDA